MHPLLQTGLVTVLAPAVVAALFLLAASVAPPGRWRSALAALGLAAGWGLGVWLAVRPPRWPPVQSSDWFFFGVALAAVLVVITPLWRGSSWPRVAGGLIFLAVVFGLVVQRYLAGQWPGPVFWLVPLAAAGLALLGVASAGSVGHSVQAAATFFLLMVFSVFVSVALTLAGSASYGHMAGILASACGAAWIVSLLLRRQVDLVPVGFVAGVILGGLLLQGIIFSNLPLRSALVLAAAWPATAVAAWLLRRGAGTWRVALTVVALIVPMALGLWWTQK